MEAAGHDWLEGGGNYSGDLLLKWPTVGGPLDQHTLQQVLRNLTAIETTTFQDTGVAREASSDLPFQLPVYLQTLWILAFGVMILGACVGNTLVIRIVLGNHRMRTTTNYFLVNLSVADLFMTLFNCVFNFVFMLKSHWAFGSVYCTISQFVAHASLAASVFTLAVISFDRFLNVMRPLKPRMSGCMCRALLCFIWVVAASLAAPILPYATTINYDLGKRTICVILWPDGLPSTSRMDYVYNVVILAVTYVVPMTAMIVCYAVIGCKLYDGRSVKTSRQADNFKSKRKVVQMLALLVGVFALCWLPYHVYFILIHHHPELSSRPYVQQMYLAFYWLAMSNAMINPIVYYFLNARFRYFSRQLFAEMRGSVQECVRPQEVGSSDLSVDEDPFAFRLQPIGDLGRGADGGHPAAANNRAQTPVLPTRQITRLP